MEIYDLEVLRVKQGEIFQQVSKYIQGEALNQDLYSVEKELFKRMLILGAGYYPLDAELNLPGRRYSYLLSAT